MDIDAVIERLQELRALGAKRVFVEDLTREGMVLDVISIEVDSDGDVLIGGD